MWEKGLDFSLIPSRTSWGSWAQILSASSIWRQEIGFIQLPWGEGHGTPLQCSCLENPRDGGAWWAAVYGVAQSQTRLKRLSSSRSSLHDLPKVPMGRFQQLLITDGRECQTREKQIVERNNNAALGQDPGSPSRDSHSNIFERSFRYWNPL